MIRTRSVVRILSLAVFLACVLASASAQSVHVAWTGKVDPPDARAGESARILVTAKTASGWHIYSLDTKGGPVPTSFELPKNDSLELNGKAIAPAPMRKFDEGFSIEVGYYEGEATFAIPVKLKPGISGQQKVTVTVKSMACDANGCDPPMTDEVPTSFAVAEGPPRADRTAAMTAVPEQPAGYKPSDGGAPKSADGEVDEFADDVQKAKDSGLWAFIVLSFVGGLLALLTPCVFPMIPITVSFFSKKTKETKKANYGGAFAYCLGIVGTFSALGLAVTAIFGKTGIQALATNPWVNLAVFVVFIVLACSLFGFFEIGVPTSILNKLGARSGRTGFVGPIFMGLTFSLTTFTCTVPIVGTLLVAAVAGGGWLYPIVGMVAFSTAFSLPFFFLALFPDFMIKLPRSGAWLGQVKVFMGFVEVGAAVKFLSNMDLVWDLGILTQPVFLWIWSAIMVFSALQLFGFLRFFGKEPADNPIGWMRRGFGVASLAVAVYFVTGIRGAPLGELAAFLPPDPYPGRATAWISTFDEGLAAAKSEGKPLFINFTGVT